MYSVIKQLKSVKLMFQVSQMFHDKEFYIVNGPSSHSKTLLEKNVAEVFLG